MKSCLEYRMEQERVTRNDLKNLLQVSEKTIRNKLSGKTDFTWKEVKTIKNKYFPDDDLECLFE